MSVAKQRKFRELLAGKGAIAVAPGCYDAMSGLIIEQAGFPIAYMSGLCVAASLGYPDTGIIAAAEMVKRAAVISRSIGIPLFADADTGYGGASNIAECVRAFERAGVAGIHLEDQSNPKKCAALPGKNLVSTQEMRARIRIALEARTSQDFVIVGRTDALAVSGLDEAIARVQAYEDAGADATMLMGVSQEADMQRITSALKKPCIVLMAEKIRPLIPNQRLKDAGYPMVLYPLSLIDVAFFAQRELCNRLMKDGTTESLLDRIPALDEINELLGMGDVVRDELRYQQLKETK
jgi:2,3-dimethylmalate lyase